MCWGGGGGGKKRGWTLERFEVLRRTKRKKERRNLGACNRMEAPVRKAQQVGQNQQLPVQHGQEEGRRWGEFVTKVESRRQ